MKQDVASAAIRLQLPWLRAVVMLVMVVNWFGMSVETTDTVEGKAGAHYRLLVGMGVDKVARWRGCMHGCACMHCQAMH